MTELWQQILAQYGQNVTLNSPGQEPVSCTAFLQPVQEQGSTWFQNLPTPLGMVRQDRWIYLGSPQYPLDQLGETGWIDWEGQAFSVRAAQPVCIGTEPLYWWGLLVLRDPEEVDNLGI